LENRTKEPVNAFFTIQIRSAKIKVTADTFVCHFSLLYRWLKEETRVNRNYIRDVINYLKKGFSLERGICLVPWYLPRQIPRYTESPRTNTPAVAKKLKKLGIGKKKYPFYQPIKRQHSYIRWNYMNNYTLYKNPGF
jgi:hypothetical protein